MRQTIARQVLNLLSEHRRTQPQAACKSQPCLPCEAATVGKIEALVEQGKPLTFVVPAFPAKSPNRQKVLGHVPDRAEKLALAFLQALCDRIAALYAPGAVIIICSDGRVFSDVVRVPDHHVTDYASGMVALIRQLKARSIHLFRLDDYLTVVDFDEMRALLLQEFGEPIETLRDMARRGDTERDLFNGLARFLLEDLSVLEPAKSRTAVRNLSKEMAYHVWQRSRAWGFLVAKQFPEAIRLSIHPQPCGSPKIGIHLVATPDTWLTPWHSTAVDLGGLFVLMKRRQAEELGGQLVLEDGQPSHLTLSEEVVAQVFPQYRKAA